MFTGTLDVDTVFEQSTRAYAQIGMAKYSDGSIADPNYKYDFHYFRVWNDASLSTSEMSELYASRSTIRSNISMVVNQDSSFSVIPTASDIDSDDVLSYSVSNLPTWATFDTVTGEISGTPNNDDIGEYLNVQITVSDQSGSSDQLNIPEIIVYNVNDNPVISQSHGNQSVDQDQSYTYDISPYVSDIDGETDLHIRLVMHHLDEH